MAFISATFQNNFGASRKWTILDTGIDPNAPSVIFNDYLDVNASTPSLQLHQDDGGVQGHAQYKRSDGPLTSVDVSAGDAVQMT